MKDFFSKYDQICKKLCIWSHLMKISLMENFIFCAKRLPSQVMIIRIMEWSFHCSCRKYILFSVYLIDWFFSFTNIHTIFHKQRFFSTPPHCCLIHFMPLISFDTPWKHQKTSGFLMFSGGMKRDQWHEMG